MGFRGCSPEILAQLGLSYMYIVKLCQYTPSWGLSYMYNIKLYPPSAQLGLSYMYIVKLCPISNYWGPHCAPNSRDYGTVNQGPECLNPRLVSTINTSVFLKYLLAQLVAARTTAAGKFLLWLSSSELRNSFPRQDQVLPFFPFNWKSELTQVNPEVAGEQTQAVIMGEDTCWGQDLVARLLTSFHSSCS